MASIAIKQLRGFSLTKLKRRLDIWFQQQRVDYWLQVREIELFERERVLARIVAVEQRLTVESVALSQLKLKKGG